MNYYELNPLTAFHIDRSKINKLFNDLIEKFEKYKCFVNVKYAQIKSIKIYHHLYNIVMHYLKIFVIFFFSRYIQKLMF